MVYAIFMVVSAASWWALTAIDLRRQTRRAAIERRLRGDQSNGP